MAKRRRRRKKTRSPRRVLTMLLLAGTATATGIWILSWFTKPPPPAGVFRFPTPAAQGPSAKGAEIKPSERERLEAVLRGMDQADDGETPHKR